MTALFLASRSWRRSLAAIDPAWAALAALALGLVLIVPTQAARSAIFVRDEALGVLPFLLLAVAAAAFTRASGADALIARAFQGRTFWMVAAAAAMGALSPFCSCGVIPLIAALLAMGVPLPAVMAFWLSSPLMDPTMFMLTWGTLGAHFALGKTAAAFGVGLLGGYGTMTLVRLPAFAAPLRPGVGDGGCGASGVRSREDVAWVFWRDRARRNSFVAGARANLVFLGKWLLLAFLLESLMVAYIPAETISSWLGGDDLWTIGAAALVGVPAYLNGYAALPLVAGLIDQGMQPGAGMAFLIAGGVSCVPAAVAIFALARLPVFLAYLGFALAGSVGAGLAFGLIA